MPQYCISFNQQWVGDHPESWYAERAVLAKAVVRDMREAGVLVVAGGLEEDVTTAVGLDPTSGTLAITTGLVGDSPEHLGGLTIVDVADDDEATLWASRIAQACGWPQELRRFHGFAGA